MRRIPAILTAGTDQLWTRKRLQTHQYYFRWFTYCNQKPFFLHPFLKICTEIKVFFHFLSRFCTTWREGLDYKRSYLFTIKGKARAQPSIREPDLSGLTWSEATGWCRWRMSYVIINEWTITYSSISFKYILYITMLLFSVKKRDNKCCEERAILDWRGHPQLNLIIWRIRIYTV